MTHPKKSLISSWLPRKEIKKLVDAVAQKQRSAAKVERRRELFLSSQLAQKWLDRKDRRALDWETIRNRMRRETAARAARGKYSNRALRRKRH
jgi:hypothetical protein